MRAVVFRSTDPPWTPAVIDVDTPGIGPRQVLVRTAFALVVRPVSPSADPTGTTGRSDPFAVLGADFAGSVVARGRERRDLEVGQAVFGWADSGAEAEFAAATAVGPLPRDLDLAAAAGLPTAAARASRAVAHVRVRPGETLLVLGASTVIGALVMQIVVAAGVRVVGMTGTDLEAPIELGRAPASGAPLDAVRSLPDGRVDAIIDASGRGASSRTFALLGSRDRVAVVAGPATEAHTVAQIDAVGALAAAVRFRIPTARVFPLTRAVEAHASAADDDAGRVLLQVDERLPGGRVRPEEVRRR